IVFIDAPHVLEIPTEAGSFEKFDSAAIPNSSGETDPKLVPRCWWRANRNESGLTEFVGFDETMEYLRKVLDEQGPFQACLGFSQGAALAAILSTAIENPNVHPAFSRPPALTQDRFRSVVLVSGFRMDVPEKWYINPNSDDRKLRTKSLHVLGRSDLIVGEDRSLPLIDCFKEARVEWHDGGHFVPSTKNWRTFFSEYLHSFDEVEGSTVPSPTAATIQSSSKANENDPKL
ncbi:serine hydrolase FSH, partial [Phakopsora pachyrhizi]